MMRGLSALAACVVLVSSCYRPSFIASAEIPGIWLLQNSYHHDFIVFDRTGNFVLSRKSGNSVEQLGHGVWRAAPGRHGPELVMTYQTGRGARASDQGSSYYKVYWRMGHLAFDVSPDTDARFVKQQACPN